MTMQKSRELRHPAFFVLFGSTCARVGRTDFAMESSEREDGDVEEAPLVRKGRYAPVKTSDDANDAPVAQNNKVTPHFLAFITMLIATK